MNTSTHEEVAQCAQQIWQEQGRPSGRDTEIWFEAERRLTAGKSETNSNSEAAHETLRTTSESKGAAALAERIKTGAAPETAIEHPSTPIPAEETVKAARQKKEARAPKLPTKTAPKSPPPESGKPLWSQPHSS